MRSREHTVHCRRLRLWLLLLLTALLAGLSGCNRATAPDAAPATATGRLEEVATRGAEVMPFDLEETTHIFEKREDGGLQQVIADNASDDEQIRLIRVHLREEAGRFQQGDFHDPAKIHGADMAGLHELVMGHERITIVYSDLPAGAQILYTTADDQLVAAIHAWFDAQLADHGEHAAGHR